MKGMRLAALSLVAAAGALGVVVAPGLAHADDGCPDNLVLRGAGPNDNVCVRARTRIVVIRENDAAPSLVEPGGGAYGPQTCKQGYVWREAFDGDTVCVTPERRTETLAQNADAPRANANPAPAVPPAGDPAQPQPPAPDCFLIFCG